MQPLILLSSSMYCKITSLHVSAEVRHFSYAESVRHCLHLEIDFDQRWQGTPPANLDGGSDPRNPLTSRSIDKASVIQFGTD